MIRRTAAASVALLVVAAVALTILTRDPWPTNDGLTVAVLAVLAGVGLVVSAKQPRNPIPWLFLATAALGLIDSVVRLYLVLDYRRHGGTLPLGRVAVDYRGGVSLLAFLVAFPAILLFPAGTPPSRRWRCALAVYVAVAAIFSVSQFVGQALDPSGSHPVVNIRGSFTNANPGSIAGAEWILTPLFLGFWIASVGHQVASWRRATGEQRTQLKWLMSGAATCVAGSVLLVAEGDGSSWPARIAADIALVGIGLLPVAIGIGILKYRLYEIDRLISRTLSYAIVTGSLVALFLGLVVLTTDVLPFSSPVGVAASTLAAAALFNPLRRRVQHVVDRRFNRARYDAEATVDAFARRLRNAVDLDMVERGLLDAVGRAVEPAHLTIWIRSTS